VLNGTRCATWLEYGDSISLLTMLLPAYFLCPCTSIGGPHACVCKNTDPVCFYVVNKILVLPPSSLLKPKRHPHILTPLPHSRHHNTSPRLSCLLDQLASPRHLGVSVSSSCSGGIRMFGPPAHQARCTAKTEKIPWNFQPAGPPQHAQCSTGSWAPQ